MCALNNPSSDDKFINCLIFHISIISNTNRQEKTCTFTNRFQRFKSPGSKVISPRKKIQSTKLAPKTWILCKWRNLRTCLKFPLYSLHLLICRLTRRKRLPSINQTKNFPSLKVSWPSQLRSAINFQHSCNVLSRIYFFSCF